MDKEKILAMSQKENKNKDPLEAEAKRRGYEIGSIAALLLAMIYFFAKMLTGQGTDYGLWSVITVINGVGNLYALIKTKNKVFFLGGAVNILTSIVLICLAFSAIIAGAK